MSRAEESARKAYPDNPYYGGRSAQRLFAEGYEQAEKDFIEKAEKWLSEHCEEHPIYPESIVVDFKRAMSELK